MAWSGAPWRCCTAAFGPEAADEICVAPPRKGASGKQAKQRAPFPWAEEEVTPAPVTKDSRLKFWSGGYSRQHPDKAAWTNADAFICGDSLLGIADGVSAVELEGYDPSQLPLELLRRCQDLHKLRVASPARFSSEVRSRFEQFQQLDAEDVQAGWPKYLLAEAFLGCETLGATTALLLGLDQVESDTGAPLAALCPGANIGDSQFLHLRFADGQWQILKKSNPQVHWFNCPYQLTRMPDTSMADDALFCQATCAEASTGFALEGDVFVLATDGVFDNCFDEQIVEVIEEACSGGAFACPPDDLAVRIVDRAIRNATIFEKETGMTPFSRLAQSSTGRTLYGGKPDDTTAAVAYVVRVDKSAQPPVAQPAAEVALPALPRGDGPEELPATATPRGPRSGDGSPSDRRPTAIYSGEQQRNSGA